MANSVDISDYPAILSMMMYRPAPTAIARWVVQPDFLQDTRIKPGEVYLMDRFGYLPDQGDMDLESRTRSDNEILGTQNTRQIPSSKIPILLREITGPGSGDPNNPGLPGNFRFSIPQMMRQQRLLWDQGFAEPLVQPQFHSSVGADTLMMDYRLCQDRFFINALDGCPTKYNPGGNVLDGGTYASGPPKFGVSDLDSILEQLVINKCPPFPDGLYRALIHPRMWTHLRQDSRFREQVQSSAFFPVSMVLANQDNVFGPGYMPSPVVDGGSNPSIPQLPTQFDYFRQPNLVGYLPYLGQALPGVDDLALPGGYVYNQFRIFVSNNIPTKQVLLNYTASTTTDPTGSALRTAYPGYFFGRHVVGEIYGGDPMTEIPVQIQRNQNSDYNRYLIVIWQAFMGLSRLNDDFVICGRTYAP